MHIECEVDGADFTVHPVTPSNEIVICAYNVERGLCLDEQLDAFRNAAGVPHPDVLLLSEADRGCTRSGGRNVAEAYARALDMRYVFGVEFVELPRVWGPGGPIRRRCEHGNAIVTRYPLGNVDLIRHRRTRSWHSIVQRTLRVGQPRLGGRVAIGADLRIGERLLRCYAVHFESGRGGRGKRSRDGYRQSQAAELIDAGIGTQHGVVIGGDMNVLGYLQNDRPAPEPTIRLLLDAGFVDAHAPMPRPDRITTDTDRTIDLIVGRAVRFIDAGVGPREIWGNLSDHLPVWARVRLDAEPEQDR